MSDLDEVALRRHLPDRALRSYPALLSTEAEALAWARSGAPHGAVVVAGYQVSPRGRGGFPWDIPPESGLGFSLVLRPPLAAHREGWLYVIGGLGLAETLSGDCLVEWPDQVIRDGDRRAALSVQAGLGLLEVEWAVVNIMVAETSPPRGVLIGEIIGQIETLLDEEPEPVLDRYRDRLLTLGREVTASLMPLGPTSPRIEGMAVDVGEDGSLVVETAGESRASVRPNDLGRLEQKS